MKQNILYTLFIWGLAICLLVACTDQEMGSSFPTPEDGKVQLTMNIRSTGFELPVTRASADENKIDDIYVLVFEKQNTSDEIDGTAIFKEATKVINTGTVRLLELTQRAGVKCNVLVIVNPGDNIYYGGSAISLSGSDPADVLETALLGANATLSDVSTNLLTQPLASSVPTTKKVPFAGEKLPISGIASVNEIVNAGVISVDLYRSLAKLTIQVKTGGIPDFELLGITVIGAPKQGQYWRLGNNLKDNSATGALLNYYYNGTTNATMLVDAASGTTANDPVYIYESRAEEKTSIILKGEYNGEIGYFKLGIQEDDGTHLDIKRNTHYEITITDVNYRGFDNIQDAIAATSCQLVYTITELDQASHDIVSDGYMYLAFSSSKLEFLAPNGEYTISTAFEILTNSTVKYSTNSIKIESGGIGTMNLLDGSDNVISEDEVIDTGTKRTTINLRLNPGFEKGTIVVNYGSLTHKLEVVRKNELWFKRNGGIKEFTGYYRAELADPATISPANVYITSDGIGASGETSILTYDTFYLHAGVTFSWSGTYYSRQIPLYLSSKDNFSGRVKCIIFQSPDL